MKLWTIQSQEAYERLLKTGTLRYVQDYEIDENNQIDIMFRDAYNYMVAQMEKRGLARPEGAIYPIWAWYQWQGKRKKRNVRETSFAEKGTKMVQLTIDIPSKDILLSDFESWHGVLMGAYMYTSEEDLLAYEKSEAFKNCDAAVIQKSWEIVFDVFRSPEGGCWTGPLKHRSIQACLWEVKIEQVKAVQFFTAR